MSPARARNPVLDGWYADPEAAVFAGRYWIFPTTSAPYDQQVSFDAFSSSDLKTWTRHRDFFFSANDIKNDSEPGGIGVAVADRPQGPYRDLLGKPLVDKFHNGAQPIDQFVFKDDDGSWYMVYGGWKHANIVKLKSDFTGVEPMNDGTVFKEITPAPEYVEGSLMFKRNGRWYYMWSEGGWGEPDYSVAYAIADRPTGPFRRIGKVMEQDPKVATSAGHNSVIPVPGSDRWYIVYHRRPLGHHDRNARQTAIDVMQFEADGHILPIRITDEGVAARPLTEGK